MLFTSILFWFQSGAVSLTGVSLQGFQANIRTHVYEDLSVARTIELIMEGDNRESIRYKRDFFKKSGYEIVEKSSEHWVITKVYPTSNGRTEVFQDDLSKIFVERRGDQFLFQEEFFNRFIINEIDRSDLKNDRPAAKVLMADTRFEFKTVLPGRIDSINLGAFEERTATWIFDIEQLFQKDSYVMRAHSETARGEWQIWPLLLISFLLFVMAYLFRLKNKIRGV